MRIDPENITVIYAKMPGKVRACVTPNGDDSYTIALASHLTREQQWAALQHELRHLERGDLYAASCALAEEAAHYE